MLLLELFQREICGGLVVTHVVVPCLREFQELGFLCGFDVLQFLLLGSSYIILLSDCLFSEKLIKLSSGLFSFLIVALNFTFLSVFLQKSKKIDDLVIGGDVDDAIVLRLL